MGRGGGSNEIIYSSISRKQGFVELYTQRLIEGNICKIKLSSLMLLRLRLSKLKLHRLSRSPGFGNFQITTMRFQTTTMGSRLENFKILNYNNGLRLGWGGGGGSR